MRKEGFDQETRSCRSVSPRKPNSCVIYPAKANVGFTAESLEIKEHCRFIRTNIASDLIIHLGVSNFHLHKLAMVSRSKYLNRVVFQRGNNGDTNSPLNIHINKLPGGSKTFELVVKFCYGLPVHLTATNAAPLYCATHFLEMSEDIEQGNLMSKAEAFLTFVILSSWKDTFRIFKSCEYIPSWARKLSIIKLCSESVAWKVCLDPKTISTGDNDEYDLSMLRKDAKKLKCKDVIIVENWWFEDVSGLRIDHFVEVINGFKAKGMKSRLVGGCITYWTSKWLSKLKVGKDCDHKKVQRLTLETLVRLLPTDWNSVSCNFHLHLLKLGLLLNINCELIVELEKRVAMNLEKCCVGDLVVKNYKNEHGPVYDVCLVLRAIEAYLHYLPMIQMPRMELVAIVVDEYLQLVARDNNLSVKCFQLLAEALPENARGCNDKLYRAIDMYLKAHSRLTEEERKCLCRPMEFHKLSQEARNHAMKNDRLPSNVIVRFMLLEQVGLSALMTSKGSNYQRSKSQAIVKVTKDPSNRLAKPNKELQVMKREVDRMKVQVSDLQVRRLQLQRRAELRFR